MRRLALVMAVVIAGDGLLAVLAGILWGLTRDLYVSTALLLTAALALYAAVLVVMGIGRSRAIVKVKP